MAVGVVAFRVAEAIGWPRAVGLRIVAVLVAREVDTRVPAMRVLVPTPSPVAVAAEVAVASREAAGVGEGGAVVVIEAVQASRQMGLRHLLQLPPSEVILRRMTPLSRSGSRTMAGSPTRGIGCRRKMCASSSSKRLSRGRRRMARAVGGRWMSTSPPKAT